MTQTGPLRPRNAAAGRAARAAARALLATLLACACAETPPDAPPATTREPMVLSAPDAPPAPALFTAVGDTVWFRIAQANERTFGDPGDSPPSRSEVTKLLEAKLVARDTAASTSTYHVRITRVWGFVEDSGGKLEFDTAGTVPQVFCRLDDVKPEIALAGQETGFTVGADGTPAPPDPRKRYTMLGMAALAAAVSICGDDLRPTGALEVGHSWDRSLTTPLGRQTLAAKLTSTIREVAAESYVVEQTGTMDATAGDAAGARGAAAQTGLAGRTHAVTRVSRRDGFVLHADNEYDSTTRLGAGGAEMRRAIRVRLERVPRP